VVQKELGIGTFGKVLLCEDRKHKDAVAIKVVRKIDRYIDSAKIEASILIDIFNEQRRHKVSYFVKMYSTFEVDGHYFMVFEPLGKSLYDVVKSNGHVGFPLGLVRTISRLAIVAADGEKSILICELFYRQLLEALHFLESIRLVHTGNTFSNHNGSKTDLCGGTLFGSQI
jgi:serine/threonine protein kinase